MEDKEYRAEKILIVNKILGHVKTHITDCEASSNLMEFMEEIFNKNKYRGEEVDEIKLISQPLVDKNILDWITDTLFSALADKKADTVANCVVYLLKTVERMNVDDEEDPYSYSQTENQVPTMDFQVGKLLSKFDDLVVASAGISRDKYVIKKILRKKLLS